MKALTKKEIKIKYNTAKHAAEKRTTEVKGSTNCYKCTKCDHVDKYLYADSGVTPFITKCSDCGATSQSMMGSHAYPALQATQEWYRPSLNHVMFMQEKYPMMVDHILNGGLVPRPIEPKEYDKAVPQEEITIGKRLYHCMFGWCKVTHPVSTGALGTIKVVVDLEADEITYTAAPQSRPSYKRPSKGQPHVLYTPIYQLFATETHNLNLELKYKKKMMNPELTFWENDKNV